MAQKRGVREDPRITRTRNLIRGALNQLIEEKPFSSVSVQDIAERATINRATFYAHFEDKYDLLEDLVRENYRRDLSKYDCVASPSISGLIQAIMLETMEHVRGRKKCKVDKEFEPQLERAMQDELHEYLSPVLGDAPALVVSSAVIGATLKWRAGRYKEAPDVLVKGLVSVLTGGVRIKRPLSAVT